MDLACQYYAVCINGGFKTNVPCRDTMFCQEKNPDTICVEGVCCTLPQIVGGVLSSTEAPKKAGSVGIFYATTPLCTYLLPILTAVLGRLMLLAWCW